MSGVVVSARGWHNGSPRPSGAGYGLAIATRDRDDYFEHSWNLVVLDLESGPTVEVALSPSFWRNCSELRSAEIGRWLLQAGAAPWPKGSPPRVELLPRGPASFAVRIRRP